MKLRKGKGRYRIPAYREYFLTLVRPNGERLTRYLPYSYRTQRQARAEASRRNYPATYGTLEVDFIDHPDSWGYDLGSISL